MQWNTRNGFPGAWTKQLELVSFTLQHDLTALKEFKINSHYHDSFESFQKELPAMSVQIIVLALILEKKLLNVHL